METVEKIKKAIDARLEEIRFGTPHTEYNFLNKLKLEIERDIEVKNVSANSCVSGSLPPIEDERIFKSRVSDWKNSYGKGTTNEEKLAMEYMASKIYREYKVRRQ